MMQEMELLVLRLTEGEDANSVRELLVRGRSTLDRVQQEDTMLFNLGKTTKATIVELRVYEGVGQEQTGPARMKALKRLVDRFLSVSNSYSPIR